MTPLQRKAITRAAVDYATRGWSVLPIGPEKRPYVRESWKARQTVRATPDEAEAWFRKLRGDLCGVGVVLGGVSGGLVVRDFDAPESYSAWAAAHADLAARLPTAKTGRGFHVYFRCPGTRTQVYLDGELRGEGVYVVAPPSIHPSGSVYEWIVPLPVGDHLPTLDPGACGMIGPKKDPDPAIERTERTEPTERAEPIEAQSKRETEETEAISGGGVEARILDAIERTVPRAFSTRNYAVFAFARALRGIPGIGPPDASTLPKLRPYVKEWWKRAEPHMLTKDWGVTWGDFSRAWVRVRHPEGTDVLARALEAAEAADPPAWAADYGPSQKLLASLCRELQRMAGDQPFFLSCAKAGDCVGVDQRTAWSYFNGFIADGVLIKHTEGTKHRATRWRCREPGEGEPLPKGN
jgi:hypothetical protein